MIELRRRYSGSAGGGQPSRLPAGYQEVEYLENTDGAYLVLSIKPQIGDAIKVKFRDALKNNNTSVCAIIGSERFGFGIDSSYKIYGNSANQFTSLVYNGKINTVLYEWKESAFALTVLNDDLTKLGSFEYPRSSTYTKININLPIFTAYYNGYNSSFTMAGNVYIYEYYRDGELFANLIPCYRTSDRVAGMYDIVNDVFYTNAGTGEFLCGADVGAPKLPSEYQEVEYLESVNYGNEYPHIDLNISLPNGYAIKTKIKISSYFSDTSCLIGATDDAHPYNRNSLLVRTSKEFGVSAGYTIFASSGLTIELDTEYEIEASTMKDSVYLKINGIEYADTQENNPRSSKSIYLFKNNMIGGNQHFMGKLYSTEIYDDSFVLVRHLYPCYRKEDDVAGMYDIVNHVFYTNAGTGKFIVGPDVIG